MIGRGNPVSGIRSIEATWRVGAGTPRSPESFVAISSEDLVQLLLMGGGKVLARQDHGVMIQAQHHLIFLRHAPIVEGRELVDALRSAGIGPGRFDRLLAELRSHGAVGT
jgi:hypothetical protein